MLAQRLLMLATVIKYMRSVLCVLILGSCIGVRSSSLYAQSSNDAQYQLNTHRISANGDSLGLIMTERAVPINHLSLNLGLFIDRDSKSLSFTSNNQSEATLEQVTSGQLTIALGLWNRINLSVSQFVHIEKYDLDGPRGNPAQSKDGLGDTSFSVKGIILNSEKSVMGLALMLQTYQSFAAPQEFLSDGRAVTLLPSLVIDANWSYVTLALNAGYLTRSQREITPTFTREEGVESPVDNPIRVGSELTYRSGISFKYIPRFLHHTFEVIGGLPIGVNGEPLRATRLELISGLKLIFNQGSYLTIGGGRGMLDSYTNPAWRVFMGIVFQPKSADTDGDGIVDTYDQCSREPEDFDDFEDLDGCPEEDNDHDGLSDLFDQCPNQAEDKNDYEDSDGCPDANRDLDKDGLPDPVDDCPQEPEDKDGFADTDGCPDDDNDRDSILDKVDRCPNQPEDYDGVQDQDGCPDEDNDNDGVPDEVDRCPMTPEDLDGDSDQDGCPEQSSGAVQDRGERLEINGKVFFDSSKAVIKTNSYKLLFEIALFLNQRPFITKIEIQGHTDRQGSRSYNIKLSERRAAAVKRFLVKEGSVDPDRLSSKGYGFDQPLVEGQSANIRAKNRRVELVVLERDEP
jgi:OmpA-OmpF porin, OOP family